MGRAEETSSALTAAKSKSQVPVWREGLAWSVLSVDYQRIVQAAGAHQVGEEALDDPPLGQDHEAAHVVAAFDDRQDQGEQGEAVLDEAAGVAAVGPDQLQLVVCEGDLPQKHVGGGAVADIRGGDHHAQQQTEGVDHDVPLAPVDELATVEAAGCESRRRRPP